MSSNVHTRGKGRQLLVHMQNFFRRWSVNTPHTLPTRRRHGGRLGRGLSAIVLFALSLGTIGSVVGATAVGTASAQQFECTPNVNCAPQNVNFIEQGSFNLSGLGVCGIEGDYAPLGAAAVDAAYDDPYNLGGTTEGNYTDREAFSFQPAKHTSLNPGDTLSVTLPHPTETYSPSGSVLPPAQVGANLSSEQTDSTVTASGPYTPSSGSEYAYVSVTIPGAASGTKVRLDAYNPYQPHNLSNAPGPGVGGDDTSASIDGYDSSNGNYDTGQVTTTLGDTAYFEVTDGSSEDVVLAATDVTSSTQSDWVGIVQTATVSFNGGTSSPSGTCANSSSAPSGMSTGDGFTYILDVNGTGYLVPNVTVSEASGNEVANLTVPSGVPTVNDGTAATLYVLDAVSPPGQGTPSNPLKAPDTPYPPGAFSISTTEDPVPGHPGTAPVFQADASSKLLLYPVDGLKSTLTTSAPSAEVGSTSGTPLTATATLNDAYDNPVNDKQVSIYASSTTSHASIVPQTPPTSSTYPTSGNDGTVAYDVTDTCAETVGLLATDVDDNEPIPLTGTPPFGPYYAASPLDVTFTAAPPVAPDALTTPATCGKPQVFSSVAVTVGSTTTTSGSGIATAPADGTTAATVNVTLADQYGNADTCQQVQLIPASQSYHATVTALDPANPCPGKDLPGYSGTDGVASFSVTDSAAETISLGVADTTLVSVWPSNAASNPADVAQITFEGADAGQSTVTASSASAPADGQPSDIVTVTLKDAGGQPLQGKSVSLTGCSNNPAVTPPCSPDPTTTITPSSATTDANGQAQFEVANNSSTLPHTVYFQARDTTDSVTVTETAEVSFTAGGASLSASPTRVIADGTGSTTVTFTLEDGSQTPIPGASVSLNASPSAGITESPGSGTTDAAGMASFAISSTTPGTVQLTATATYTATSGCVGALSGTTCTVQAVVNVTFIHPPASFAISASPATNVPSDGVASSQVTVTALDADGNPVAGIPVALEHSGSAQVSPTTATTSSNGQATFSVTDATAETVTLSAEYGEIGSATPPGTPEPGSATVQFVRTEAEQSTISPTSASAPADGSSPVTLTVTLVGGANLPISGHTVVLETGSSTTSVTPSNVGGVTNGSGQVSFTITDTVPENLTVYARDLTTGTIVNETAAVSFTPTEVQLGTITANPSSAPAGGLPGSPNTSTVTVALVGPSCKTDDVGNVIKLTSPSGTVSISPATVTTGTGGTAVFTVSDTAVETVVLTATDTTCGKTLANTGTVSFTANEANQSTLAINPASTPANGPAATLTVTLRSGSGAPVTGETVSVHATGSAVVAPEASSTGGGLGVTNSEGVALFAITDPTVETVTLSAYDGTTELYQMATITFTGSEANQSKISAASSSLPADGATPPVAGTTTTVAVTLLGAGDLPLVGNSVSLSSSSSSVSISPAVATTDGAGTATFTVSDSKVETVVFSARDLTTGVSLVQTVSVDFYANEQNQSTLTSSATIVQARKSATITVTLLDASDAPLAGHTVTLSVSPSKDVTVKPITPNGVTNVSGVAQFSVSSSITQAVTITVTDTTASVQLYKTVSVTFAKP